MSVGFSAFIVRTGIWDGDYTGVWDGDCTGVWNENGIWDRDWDLGHGGLGFDSKNSSSII